MDLCGAAAEQGIERHTNTGSASPCGTHTGEAPALMLGVAGIGFFYLRLENPSIPSVLLLRSQPPAAR